MMTARGLKKTGGARQWVSTAVIIFHCVISLGLACIIFFNFQSNPNTYGDSGVSAPSSSPALESGIALGPSDTKTPPSAIDWHNKGNLFLSSGNYTEAIDAYSRAVALDPCFAEAYDGRAFSYYKLGKLQEAIKDLGKVIEARPRDATAYCIRGNLHLRLGNIRESGKDMNRVVELEPITHPELM